MRQINSHFGKQLKCYLKSPVVWAAVLVTLVIGAVNVATKIDDFANAGRSIDWRQPIVTEYSSALMIILLLPFVFAFFERTPITQENWLKRVPTYATISILFSAFHVAGMVLIRKIIWPVLWDGPYQFFGHWFWTSFYEYRKDTITFLLLYFIFFLDQQLRLAKEKPAAPEPITLKSGATTILLQPAEFLYAKSAGNYAEVTSLSGTQLARVTLKKLENLLINSGCNVARIHRSCIVNRSAIMETSPIAGGDLTVKLRGGETLRASRRYRDNLEI